MSRIARSLLALTLLALAAPVVGAALPAHLAPSAEPGCSPASLAGAIPVSREALEDGSPWDLALPIATGLVPDPALLSPSPVPNDVCRLIQPGSRMESPSGCSMNWVFTDGTDLYIGTAGHCVSRVGEGVSLGFGVGYIGNVVYRINAGVGSDFALVKIDPSKRSQVSPSMCHWGGPTDAFGGKGAHVVRHYGNGMLYGSTTLTRPRTGVGSYWIGTTFGFVGTVLPGDSGSPARIESGEAAGIITHLSADSNLVYGTRITRAMYLAEAATGIRLQLLTAPVA